MSFYRWWSCILTHRWNWRFVTLATPAFVPVLHEVRTDVDHNLCNLPCQWKMDLRWMLNRRKPSFFLGYRRVLQHWYLLSFELIHSRKGRTPELWKRNVAMNVQHLDILPTVLKHDFFHCNVITQNHKERERLRMKRDEQKRRNRGKLKAEKWRPKSLYGRAEPDSFPYYPRLWGSGTGVLSRNVLSLLDRNWPFIAAVCWTRLRITGETYFYIGHKDIKDPTIARIRRSTR